MEWLIEMTNGSFLTVYTLASLAAWHLLKGKIRYLAIPALLACTFIAVQIGESMLFAFVMLGSAYLFSCLKSPKKATA
jgi:amino acid efflux transporter